MKFRIYGEIKDNSTGQAVVGASIKLFLNKEELQRGKSAKNGFYELIAEIDDSRIESGQQLLVTFEMEGYQRQKNLVLATEGSFNLDAKLEAAPSPPQPKKHFNWVPVIIAGGVVLVLLVVGVILFLKLRTKLPEISSFSADPNSIESGQSATLSWKTTNAVNAKISPDVGDVDESGSMKVSPNQTTTYTLIARNKKGKEVKSEAEILIIHSKPSEYKNLALEAGSKASQSATAYGGSPERAIDGNPDGNYSHNSVTHTDDRLNSWWQVELPKPAKIEEIVIWNRSDCCGNRLSNLRISVLDDSQKEVWGKNFRGPVNQGGSVLFKPDTTVSGRFVKVQIQGKNIEGNGFLSLAEVQAFGMFME
ncbi:MAG: discoidin domain-containing protein [bacterium]